MGSDRAVPAVAAIANALSLPGISAATAKLVTDKISMRSRLTSAGLRQPKFARLTSHTDRAEAIARVGLPAVLKPADSAGQRGLFAIRHPADLDEHLTSALGVSEDGRAGGEGSAILEQYVEGPEVNVIAVARNGNIDIVSISDRLRPNGMGFGVGWVHLFPSELPSADLSQIADAVRLAASAVGLTNGIAFPQIIAGRAGSVVIEIAARMAAGEMSDLVKFGTGVDIAAIAVRQACGISITDDMLSPRWRRPHAIRFLTSHPGVVPSGILQRRPSTSAAEATPGVCKVGLYMREGEEIRPVQSDADRRGYILARAASARAALAIADEAANKLRFDVTSS
jgi:cysteine synthase A